MASGSGSRAGTGKRSTSSSSQARRTPAKKGAGSRSASGNRKANTPDNITGEVILIGVFALLVLLFLCNFGIIGAAGNVVSGCLFGIFGMIAYIIPVLAGAGLIFGLANRGNRTAMMKIAAGVILTLLMGVALELTGGQVTSMDKYSVSLLYTVSAETKTGGGVLSGSLAYLLDHFLGMVGAVLLVLVLSIICMVIITERSFVGGVKSRSRRVYESAREDARVRKERARQRREEMEARREEERIRKDEEEARRDAEKILRMDRRVSGVMMDTALSAGERPKERNEAGTKGPVQKGTGAGIPAKEPKAAEVSGVAKNDNSVVDFERIRIHTSTEDMSREESAEAAGSEEGSAFGQKSSGHIFSWQAGFDSKNRNGGEEGASSAPPKGVEIRPGEHGPSPAASIPPEDPLAKTYGDADVFRDMKMITRGGTAAAVSGAVISGAEFTAAGNALAGSDIVPPADGLRSVVPETVSAAAPGEDFSSVVIAPTVSRVSMTAYAAGMREKRPVATLTEGETAPENGTAEEAFSCVPSEESCGMGASDISREEITAMPETLSDVQEESSHASPVSEDTRSAFLSEDLSPESGEPALQDPEAEAPEAFRKERQSLPDPVRPDSGLRAQQTESRPAHTPAASGPAARPAAAGRIAGKQEAEGTATVRTSEPVRPYQYPPVSLLRKTKGGNSPDALRELKSTAVKLQQTLATFGVKVTITDISQGPAITRYELQPEQGVKVSKIMGLADDIKLNLAATDIRIEAPIPGKAAVGIEVPNKESSMVGLRELLESREFREFPSKITFAVGKDIAGRVVVSDIARMPHMLIAGSTGSGKSVCINTLIMSILYKAKPDEVKLILIDPKVVELSIYNGIPHLLIPVVSDPRQASSALHWGVAEMTDRYQKFADMNVRDLKGYNRKAEEMRKRGDAEAPEILPQIVIIVDELADLMMVAPGEVEESICRLAQLARAAGIHLIIATQRPSVDVITGLIKANMPSRVAFAVSSGVDSRTILDMNGAEKLLGKGDMLFYPQGYPKPVRVQGAFVSDNEVSDVVDYLKNQVIGNVYDDRIMEKVKTMESGGQGAGGGETELDAYFEKAARFIIDKDKASIGMLQRVLRIGFNRAARIMDQLAEAGVVGEEEGTKPRRVLMSEEQFEQYMEEYR